VKGRIKHAHLGHLGQQGHHGLDALDVGRVVQGGQLGIGVQGTHHVLIDAHRAGKGFATVHHPVTHGFDLACLLQHAGLGVDQHVQHQLDGILVVLHLQVAAHDVVAVGAPVGQAGVAQADFFDDAAGQHCLFPGVEVKELILDGRASAVEDQNLHPRSFLRPRARIKRQRNALGTRWPSSVQCLVPATPLSLPAGAAFMQPARGPAL